MKRLATLWYLVLLILLLANCSAPVNINGPVRIFRPIWGAGLHPGQKCQLEASIRPDYPIEYVQVRLWDVNSSYETSWRIDNPSGSLSLSLSEVLIVPEGAPLGNDYRLDVIAYPGKQLEGDVQGAFGYTQKVTVAYAR